MSESRLDVVNEWRNGMTGIMKAKSDNGSFVKRCIKLSEERINVCCGKYFCPLPRPTRINIIFSLKRNDTMLFCEFYYLPIFWHSYTRHVKIMEIHDS